MDNQVALLPCPFCGGEAKLYNLPDEHPYIYRVGCINCKTAYGYSYSHSEKYTAIKTWNERIPLDDRITELEKERDEMQDVINDLTSAEGVIW